MFDIANIKTYEPMKNFILIISLLLNTGLVAQEWTVNPVDYEFSMNITGQVSIDELIIDQQNATLGAFVEGECRGVCSPTQEGGNFESYLITIYSNITEGETITFKWLDESDVEYTIMSYVIFYNNSIMGSLTDPFIFSDTKAYTAIDEEELRKFKVYPNPATQNVFVDISELLGTYDLKIYNVLGNEVFSEKKIKDNVNIDLLNFKTGMYFMVIEGVDKILTRKLIVI